MKPKESDQPILCIGEVLWDALPAGLFLGGAPLNVSMHLHQLGEAVQLISRVGNDQLGDEAVRRIEARGVSTRLIQRDERYPTGMVKVQFDERDDPAYEIIQPAAWDNITFNDTVEASVTDAWGVVFGSLAMRNSPSRDTIRAVVHNDIRAIFDINLREPFIDRSIIEESLHSTDILKLNEEELDRVIRWFGVTGDHREAIRAIARLFDCETVAVTRGPHGAALYHHGDFAVHPGFEVKVADVVGAGDAFLAALLLSIRAGDSADAALAFANAAGAYTASHVGALPEYTAETIKE